MQLGVNSIKAFKHFEYYLIMIHNTLPVFSDILLPI